MKKLVSLFICLAFAATAMAKPAYRGPITRTLADGTEKVVYLHGDEHFHYMTDEAGEWLDETTMTPMSAEVKAKRLQAGEETIKARRARKAKEGVGDEPNPAPRGLVILAEYQDTKFTKLDEALADSMLNGANFTRNYSYKKSDKTITIKSSGSARKYFQDQSYGKYNPHFDVFGPVTLSHEVAYYGAEDGDAHDIRPREMIAEACQLAYEAGADFSLYDNDGDNTIDIVYVIYAGYGQADGGGANTIWPHQWDASNQGKVFNGKRLARYACGCELNYQTKVYDGIGTFCHEFSHVLGLPDFYITVNGVNHHTLVDWDIMDYGPYNNDGNTPPSYSAYERYYMGWLTPTLLTDPAKVSLKPINADNGYSLVINASDKLPTPGWQPSPNVFYMLETRKVEGWDEFIAGPGLMITKVMYSQTKWKNNTVNNDPNAMGVDILEAVANTGKLGRPTDLFPAGATEWTALEDHEITNITRAKISGAVTFLYRGGPTEGIEDVEAEGGARKVLRDGKIYIIRNGVTYDLNGQTLDR